jgi:hypothetical protein
MRNKIDRNYVLSFSLYLLILLLALSAIYLYAALRYEFLGFLFSHKVYKNKETKKLICVCNK